MFANLNGWHLLIVLAVILLLFGATRLPALSKSLGQSMRIFRSETKAMKAEEAAPDAPASATPASTPASAPAAEAPVAAKSDAASAGS